MDDTTLDPNYLVGEFLEDFQLLPTNFYQPGAPEKFQDFIEVWGTHLVKSVQLGGKFSLKNTAKSKKSVTVEEFKESTQQRFEDILAESVTKAIQESSHYAFPLKDGKKFLIENQILIFNQFYIFKQNLDFLTKF